jgi:hypothetical protein
MRVESVAYGPVLHFNTFQLIFSLPYCSDVDLGPCVNEELYRALLQRNEKTGIAPTLSVQFTSQFSPHLTDTAHHFNLSSLTRTLTPALTAMKEGGRPTSLEHSTAPLMA